MVICIDLANMVCMFSVPKVDLYSTFNICSDGFLKPTTGLYERALITKDVIDTQCRVVDRVMD